MTTDWERQARPSHGGLRDRMKFGVLPSVRSWLRTGGTVSKLREFEGSEGCYSYSYAKRKVYRA